MTIFDVLTLFGGLAMFLYGMRLMGDSLKEGSSGTLKLLLENVTNNPIKAFLLGVFVTAIIQSSTATIVITSGLVGAGMLSLHQALGIIIGANVGTTVTGQIIRLLDIGEGGSTILQLFKPSTLAPIALIIGIVLIMGFKFQRSRTVGNIAMGFGILFSGLLNMTSAVNAVSQSGLVDRLFSSLGENPLIGYITGAGVAFVLQSSSATIGILQAFSQSGLLIFKMIAPVIVGIYLGDCVTTAIVCSIGARAEAKRVGAVNILFNLSETVLVLAAVTILHQVGVLNGIWERTVDAGMIANTNTIFNLGCAILLFPMIPVYEKLARKIVKDEPEPDNPYKEKLEALNPVFYNTPALALRSCYELLLTMFRAARANLRRGMSLIENYDEKTKDALMLEEDYIDMMTDRVSRYIVDALPHMTDPYHISIFDQYYKVVTDFERLGDHAVNIAESAEDMASKNAHFSKKAMDELHIVTDLLDRILDNAELAFGKRNVDAAYRIEPLLEVADDLITQLKGNHLKRISTGRCDVKVEPNFMNLTSDLLRVADLCSNIGAATIIRVNPELGDKEHDYYSKLHSGRDEEFNKAYNSTYEEYSERLSLLDKA